MDRQGFSQGEGDGRAALRSAPMHGAMSEERLRRVLLHVAMNLQGTLSLEELASVAGTSRAHFARQFRRSTGSSPHQYVLHCRLALAREMLQHTQLSLGEVALRVGFVDQSHLNRRFRASLGVTPGLFAQHARSPSRDG